LAEDISRYQSTLKYAQSKLDYSVGEGLYMVPSNMSLKSLVIEGYNDKIIVNTTGHELGKITFPEVAERQPIPRLKVRPTHADPQGNYVNRQTYVKPLDAHNEEKQALILGLTGLTLSVLWFVK